MLIELTIVILIPRHSNLVKSSTIYVYIREKIPGVTISSGDGHKLENFCPCSLITYIYIEAKFSYGIKDTFFYKEI